MNFYLNRAYYKKTYIIGKLYCDDDRTGRIKKVFVCDTLEPKSGHLTCSSSPKEIIRVKKKKGVVAIPPGKYPMLITKSPKFCEWLPQLINVPGFSGIRIHAGNTPDDTRGCILPGWNTKKGMVCDSRAALASIMDKMIDAYRNAEPVYIIIKA